MTSLEYNTIYSRLFTKVEAYDFIDLSEEMLDEFLCNWLHSASANPYVRRLFSSFVMDDELKQLDYEMKHPIDESTDKEFVVDVLALGTAIAWLEPKINSISNISQMFGTKYEKFYSQSQHLSELRNLRSDYESQQRRMIADRGSVWNSYLGGE